MLVVMMIIQGARGLPPRRRREPQPSGGGPGTEMARLPAIASTLTFDICESVDNFVSICLFIDLFIFLILIL